MGTTRAIWLVGVVLAVESCARRSVVQEPGEAAPQAPRITAAPAKDTTAGLDSIQEIRLTYRLRKDKEPRVDVDTLRISHRLPVSYTLPPLNWPRTKPWRPHRHFGPFREGSDFAEIQMLLRGETASWYWNDYFATVNPVDDPGAEAIYRLYYRPNLASDPPNAAVFPTTRTPALSLLPGGLPQMPAGNIAPTRVFATDMVLALQQIDWSSRFGGSVAYRFSTATMDSPSQGLQHGEDFSYEFVLAVSDGRRYRLDADAVDLSLFVNPKPGFMNPKAFTQWSATTYGVELTATGVHGYDGSAELPSAVADSLMDVALEIVTAKISAETGNQNTWKYEGSRFAHAWIHNQHQGILAFHEKATQIWISDGWLDLDTDDYVAYIYAKWKITDLDATAAGGLFEGHPEWIVDVDVEEQMEGASSATEHSHTLRFDGSESSNWVTLTGLRADACTDLDHVDVAFEVEEDDPGPNTHLGSSGRRLRLNCVTITQQAAQQFYGGRVPGGMLPGVTGSLLGCEEEGSLFTIDPSTFCLDNNDVLRGSVPGGFDTLGETLVFFAEMDWKAEAWLVAR